MEKVMNSMVFMRGVCVREGLFRMPGEPSPQVS